MREGPSLGDLVREEWHRLTEAERRLLAAVARRERTARNVNDLAAERMTTGERAAEAMTDLIGSWRFILVLGALLAAWIAVNVVAWIRPWDPYPFILLNLVLGFQAAFAGPIIMMSQNRQAAKDRLRAEEDYRVNLRAEIDVAAVHARLEALAGEEWQALLDLQRRQLDLLTRIEALTREVHRAATSR